MTYTTEAREALHILTSHPELGPQLDVIARSYAHTDLASMIAGAVWESGSNYDLITTVPSGVGRLVLLLSSADGVAPATPDDTVLCFTPAIKYEDSWGSPDWLEVQVYLYGSQASVNDTRTGGNA